MAKKTSQPGREPWMSDAGYASWLRANEAAPPIGEAATCRLAVKCPKCDHLMKLTFEAVVNAMESSNTLHDCEACGVEFFTRARLELSVAEEDDG